MNASGKLRNRSADGGVPSHTPTTHFCPSSDLLITFLSKPLSLSFQVMPTHTHTPTERERERGKLTLHKTRHDLTPRLQQRMPHHNLQKPLQPLPPVLNHIVAEPVRKHLARQGRDRDPCALPLEDVAEVFEVAVASADGAVLELEGGDVGSADDFVVRVHAARSAVGLGVFDLLGRREGG